MLRDWEFHLAQLAGLDFVPGSCHIAAKASAAPYSYWRDDRRVPSDRLHSSVADAYSAAGEQNGNNNVIFLTPDSHSQASALTFNKNMTHLVGMYPATFRYQRSRIGHSANCSPLLTVSGYGNLLQNIHLMYGRGAAANLSALTISGEGNVLKNCNIACYNATELDTSGFNLLDINSGEGYALNCNFGTDSVASGAVALVRLYGPADRSCRWVFENCTFIMNQDAGQDGYFLQFAAGAGEGCVIFLNCRFINTGTTMTLGIDGTGMGNQIAYFDNRCTFVGVTDVVGESQEGYVFCGGATYTAAATSNLLAANIDHTA